MATPQKVLVYPQGHTPPTETDVTLTTKNLRMETRPLLLTMLPAYLPAYLSIDQTERGTDIYVDARFRLPACDVEQWQGWKIRFLFGAALV